MSQTRESMHMHGKATTKNGGRRRKCVLVSDNQALPEHEAAPRSTETTPKSVAPNDVPISDKSNKDVSLGREQSKIPISNTHIHTHTHQQQHAVPNIRATPVPPAAGPKEVSDGSCPGRAIDNVRGSGLYVNDGPVPATNNDIIIEKKEGGGRDCSQHC